MGTRCTSPPARALAVDRTRAKGLEFDHIAVLDGSWNKINRGEDPDASRRLYYVAMTRARQTLSLVRFQGSRPAGGTRPDFVMESEPPMYGRLHSMPYAFPKNGSVLHRTSDGLAAGNPGTRTSISAAQSARGQSGIRRALLHQPSSASRDSRPVARRSDRDADCQNWLLGIAEPVRDGGVGVLPRCLNPHRERDASPPQSSPSWIWSREASEPQYRDHAKCDAWEVVVPELVFEPSASSTSKSVYSEFFLMIWRLNGTLYTRCVTSNWR